MEEATAKKQEQEDGANVLPFKKPQLKVSSGGNNENPFWLREITPGYAFGVRPKAGFGNNSPKYACNLMHVLIHLDRMTKLAENISGQAFWVVTNDFSLSHELLDVIAVETSDPQTEEAPPETE